MDVYVIYMTEMKIMFLFSNTSIYREQKFRMTFVSAVCTLYCQFRCGDVGLVVFILKIEFRVLRHACKHGAETAGSVKSARRI